MFIKHLFLFGNDLVPIRKDFLLVEAATEKCSTKISVKKFRYVIHEVVLELWSKLLKIPVRELLKNVLLQRYFSRILTTNTNLNWALRSDPPHALSY